MKKFYLLFFLMSIIGCSSPKNSINKLPYSKFEVTKVPIVFKNDTLSYNELRFYKIKSALDAMVMMYENYGRWNNKISSKYQNNINRIVWHNVKILPNQKETFTVIADGTETMENYFASLMIFDSNEKDCLDEKYPFKDEILNAMLYKFSKLKRKDSSYKVLIKD